MAYNKSNYAKEEHAFQRFQRDIKGKKLAGTVFLHGTEQFLVTWAKNQLIKMYVPEASKALDLAVYTPNNFNMEEMIAACETPPLLAEKKLILIDNFHLIWGGRQSGFDDPQKEQLKKYVSQIPSWTLLVVVAPTAKDAKTAKFGTALSKAVVAAGTEYNFERLERKQLLGFMKKRLVARNKTAGTKTLEKLVEDCGYYNKEIDYGLYHLTGDLEKICAYSEGTQITDEDVEICLSDNLEHNIFLMLECISDNRKTEALRLLHDLLRWGTSAYQILTMVQQQFELMLAVALMRNHGLGKQAMSKELGGIHQYRLQRLIHSAAGYNPERLKRIFSVTVETERRIKTGRLSEELALELLVAEI